MGILFTISPWRSITSLAGGGEDIPGFVEGFILVLPQDYREYNRLPPRWLLELPCFLKLTTMDLFAIILFAWVRP